MATLRKKNSAFLAFQQHELDFDSDGSEDERAQKEQKEKEKQKKKSKAKKKKNTDNSLLKDLAMCAGTSKKNKAKAKAKGSAPQQQQQQQHQQQRPQPAQILEQPAQEVAAIRNDDPTTAKLTMVAASSPETVRPNNTSSSVRASTVAKASPVTAQANTRGPMSMPRPTPTPGPKSAAATSPKPAPESPRKQTNRAPIASSPTQQQPQQDSNSSDLGAIYVPTHITVTRADGQVSRQIAVAEMMDQLVRFQQHTSQLNLANRNLQEHLQRDAGIITSLQNEVAMFRQLCLNLQTEVTQLRSAAAGSNVAPSARPYRPPPPPGMT